MSLIIIAMFSLRMMCLKVDDTERQRLYPSLTKSRRESTCRLWKLSCVAVSNVARGGKKKLRIRQWRTASSRVYSHREWDSERNEFETKARLQFRKELQEVRSLNEVINFDFFFGDFFATRINRGHNAFTSRWLSRSIVVAFSLHVRVVCINWILRMIEDSRKAWWILARRYFVGSTYHKYFSA